MNRLLAIETSGEACSVALYLDGEVRERHEHAPMRHAELLLPAVRSLLEEADIPLTALDAIAFGRGPGSFTSLRIGIGVVQGLAWGADLPVIPVSSLSAVAQQVLDSARGAAVAECAILVAVDARMQEVFHGWFAPSDDGVVVALGEEGVSAPGVLAVTRARLTPGATTSAPPSATPSIILGAGNGFARYPELVELGLRLFQVQPEIVPRATALVPLARHWLSRHRALPAEEAQPVYVRNRVAEKPS